MSNSNSGMELGKLLGLRQMKTSDEITKYNERRFKQLAVFYGFAVSTFIFSKIAYRGIIKRRCKFDIKRFGP